MPSVTLAKRSGVESIVRREAREARLERLGFLNYTEYLASPQWAAKRARYRASDLPQDCVLCGATKVLLHHRTYERVGEEELTDLVPLCATCHQDVHALERNGQIELGDVEGLKSAVQAARYAPDAEERRSRAKADIATLERGEDELRKRLRTIRAQLLSESLTAYRRDRDIESALRSAEQAVEQLEAVNGKR